MIGCRKVIGVDRVKSRLELARTLGASDSLDTSSADLDIVGQVKKLTGGEGATIVIDTTGVPALLEGGLQFTASRGKMIIVGVPPADYLLNVHAITHMGVCCSPFQRCHSVGRTRLGPVRKSANAHHPQTGRFLMGSLEGDSDPGKVCMQSGVVIFHN